MEQQSKEEAREHERLERELGLREDFGEDEGRNLQKGFTGDSVGEEANTREGTSKTKISSVTIDGLNLSGGIDEPERVEEEIFVWNPPDIEAIDDPSPVPEHVESSESISPREYDRLTLGNNVFDGSNAQEQWRIGHFSHDIGKNVLQTEQYVAPTPIRAGDNSSDMYAFQRSMSVPNPNVAGAGVEQMGPSSPDPENYYGRSRDEAVPERLQNIWLRSAAEVALAASGTTPEVNETLDKSVSFQGTNRRNQSVSSNGKASPISSAFSPTGSNAFGRASSYAPTSTGSEQGAGFFPTMKPAGYSQEYDAASVAAWGATPQFQQGNKFRNAGDGARASPSQEAMMMNSFEQDFKQTMPELLYRFSFRDQQLTHDRTSPTPGISGSRSFSPNGVEFEMRRLFLNNIAIDADIEFLQKVLESFGTLIDMAVYQSSVYNALMIEATFLEADKARLALNKFHRAELYGRIVRASLHPAESFAPAEGKQQESLGRSNSEVHTRQDRGSNSGGQGLVMNLEGNQMASKARRNTVGHGSGKSFEYFDPAEAERAFRLLNLSNQGMNPVRVGMKTPIGPGHSAMAGHPSMMNDAKAQVNGLAPDPMIMRMDTANFARMGRPIGSPFPVMVPVTAPAPSPNVQSSTQPKYQLNIAKVLSGEETRTALMIRNIPNKYNQKMMLQTLENNNRGVFDFFYLPIDFKNKCNVGYAFINFRTTMHIVPFFQEFHGRKWGKFNSEKVCVISFARIQGKANLIAHFQNSSLMNEDPKCRPIIFGENGEQEEFPVGPHVRTKRGPSAREAKMETSSPVSGAAFPVTGGVTNNGRSNSEKFSQTNGTDGQEDSSPRESKIEETVPLSPSGVPSTRPMGNRSMNSKYPTSPHASGTDVHEDLRGVETDQGTNASH